MPNTQENFRVGELFTYDNGEGIVEVHSVRDKIGVVGVELWFCLLWCRCH